MHREAPKKADDGLIAAADIETVGLGGAFIEACIVLEDRPKAFYHFRTIPKLLEFMAMHSKYTFFFHNGSGYDFSYFIPDLYRLMEKHGAKVSMVRQGDSRIIGVIVKIPWRGKVYSATIRDSLPLLNMSLAKATEAFAPDLPKLDIGLSKGVTYDPKNAVHVGYLHRDVESLVGVLKNFTCRLVASFGVTPGWTAGSTAVRAWKSVIPEGCVYWRQRPEVEHFCRLAYYGGYVYPGRDRHWHQDVKSVDINGAYARAMRKGVPVGTPAYTLDFEEGRPGIYRVKAHVPRDIPYPMLPSRHAKGGLLWATGTFETVITSEEMVFARARGVTFEVVEGYYWTRIEYPFNDFLDKCEAMEMEPELKPLAKLMRNSLYGKFGSRFTNTALALSMDCPVDSDWRPVIDSETGEMVVGLIEHEEEADANYIMPHWAAWITMHQRLYLFEIMEAVGIEDVFYCDTDSVKGTLAAIDRVISGGMVVIGRRYGDCKVDEEYAWFQVLGTKNYRGKHRDGTFSQKCKGIPQSALTVLSSFLAAHGREAVVSFTSVNSLLSRIKNPNSPVGTTRTRTIGTLERSLSWVCSPEGSIRPIHLGGPTEDGAHGPKHDRDGEHTSGDKPEAA